MEQPAAPAAEAKPLRAGGAPHWLVLAALAVFAAGAFLFRASDIENRPIHTDEAVHAYKLGEFLATGTYRYDPVDYKGPTLLLSAAPLALAAGQRSHADLELATLRLTPLLWSILLGLAPLLGWRLLGGAGTLTASAMLFLSPCIAFYSRVFIHEMAFAALAVLLLLQSARFLREPTTRNALLASVLGGLLHATKETCLLVFAAMAAGGLACAVLLRRDEAVSRALGALRQWKLVAWLLVPGALLSAAIYTRGFLQPGALADVFRAYWLNVERGAVPGDHQHPFGWYFQLAMRGTGQPGPQWTEWPIVVLGAAGFVAGPLRGLGGGRAAPLFLAAASVALWLAFSAVSYKTPWNILAPLALSCVGAGMLGQAIWASRWVAARAAAPLLAAGAAFVLAPQLPRTIGLFEADPRNPWVYAQTSHDFLRLEQRFADIGPFVPGGEPFRIDVIGPDPWPLPWTLRRNPLVGYFPQVPEQSDAWLVVCEPDDAEAAAALFDEPPLSEFYGVRPEVLRVLLIERSVWNAFLDSRRTPAP